MAFISDKLTRGGSKTGAKMAVIREGNFRGRASLQIDWKGAFSRHFAINFSSASGFEAEGEGEGQSRGKSKAATQTWALGAKRLRKQEGEGVDGMETRLLFTEEEQRAVYTVIQSCVDAPGRGRAGAVISGTVTGKPRGGSCY